MTWGSVRNFPRAIMHVDGDSFFASCEVAKNPFLRGKPVITGKERGIVSACTYEAKARGVKRGMRLSEVRARCPEAIILPSDYETYSLFSERMYEIVRRYTPAVEEYSIDECFADLTGMRRVHHLSYEHIAARVRRELNQELGMTFSIGLSATKVLAKIGSKGKKPDSLTVIPLGDVDTYLSKIPVGSIWGIGPQTAAYLNVHGVQTALQLAHKDDTWVHATLTKPTIEIWNELNGKMMSQVDTEDRNAYQSISKTKTFTPPSTDAAFVYAQLSKNVENACIKARRWNLAAPEIFFFLKTQDFKFHGYEIKLPHPSTVPQDILREIAKFFPLAFKRGVQYRATGVTLLKLSQDTHAQLDLFGSVVQSQGYQRVFESVDELSAKYGKHVIFLGSSFKAMTHAAHTGARGDTPTRAHTLFKAETARRHLAIPLLGEVS
jgi:DNA polymerase-4